MANSIWKKQLIHVGCLSTAEGLPLITEKQTDADLIELRFDALYARHADALELVLPVLQNRKNPVLLTLRTKNEGGFVSWKSTERIHLFRKLLPFVDAVDFELANLPLINETLLLARKLDKQIVLSSHSVSRKITYQHGVEVLGKFRKRRAAVYKLATLARNRKDLGVLAKLLLNHPELRLAVMALGPMAELSRRALPLLGSRMVYGYLDAPVVKGQPSVAELRQLALE